MDGKERFGRRWWLYSNFEDFILSEVAYHRKFNEEIKLPKQTVWSWGEDEVRTELNVDT